MKGTLRVYEEAEGQKKTGHQPGQWLNRAGGGVLVTVHSAAP